MSTAFTDSTDGICRSDLPMIHIFTITARNYLSLALTLGDSIAYHHPEARFTICVADGLDGLNELLPTEPHSGHQLIAASDVLSQEQLDDLSFKYNITEFCTAIKPTIFKALFAATTEAKLIYYLDPDTHLYQRLDPITKGAPNKTLYLAPHLIDCRLEDNHPYREYHHLWEGIFNLGFCALRRTHATARILAWWEARLREYCYADYFDGLHTDQKWMDYAPVFFQDELQIVRHYGVNAAHWNLSERPLSQRNGQYFVGPDPLILFHFSGFDFSGFALTKHAPVGVQAGYSSETLTTLAEDYRRSVIAIGYERFISIPYAFARFDDGTPVTQPLRRLYRVRSKEASLPCPFSASGSFYRELADAQLLDHSAAATLNYSKATVDDVAGKIRIVGRAMRVLLKLVGFRRYAQLVKLAAWLGRIEHHGFLLNRQA